MRILCQVCGGRGTHWFSQCLNCDAGTVEFRLRWYPGGRDPQPATVADAIKRAYSFQKAKNLRAKFKLIVGALLLSACAVAPIKTDYPAVRVENETSPICSGVVIGPHEVLTAAHCVLGPLWVSGRRVKYVTYPYGAERDIAVLLTGAAAAHAAGSTPTEHLSMRGYGCSHMERLETRQFLMLHGNYVAGKVCGGDSGAGVYNDRGELVGIVTAYFEQDGEPGGVVEFL